MEVMSVVDSGIGMPQNVQKVPQTTDILSQSPQNDSLLSSTYEGNTELEQSQNKNPDTHRSNDPYPESTRGSEGGISESKDSGYGLKLDKTDAGSVADPPGRKFTANSQVNMNLPKVATQTQTASGQKGSKLKTGKKGLIHPLNPRGKVQDESQFDVNPEAVPFLPQNFMSSTVLRKITVPKRHLDTFGGMEYSVTGRRGVILHTDRYHWSSFQPLDGMSQRDRLIAELTYMEKLRGVKRRREVLPHRAQLDLIMGGRKIEMEERFDITREIQKLKSLVLPQHAKDLFHGRGFKLPDNHASVKPRGTPYNIAEEVSASAPASLEQHFQVHPGFLSQRQPSHPTFITSTPSRVKKRGQLPSLNKRHAMKDESYPAIKSKHSVLPSVEANSLSRSPADWVADQNRRILEGRGRVEVPAPPIVDDKHKHHDSDVDIDMGDRRPGVAASPAAPPPTVVQNRTVTSPGPTEPTVEDRHSVSPNKGLAAHPLKGAELVQSVPANEQDLLRATFQRLDTDMDGSLNYTQLKTQLPKTFSPAQEMFVKHVYDLTHSSTSLFGVEDFMNMTQLTQALANLEGDAMTAFQRLDTHNGVDKAIKKYVELFQSVDRSNRGKISVESLQGILSTGLERDLVADDAMWKAVQNTMGIASCAHVSKLEFLAHLPYFLSLGAKS